MSIKDRSRKLNTTKSRKISEKNDGDRERHHYMWLIMVTIGNFLCKISEMLRNYIIYIDKE